MSSMVPLVIALLAVIAMALLAVALERQDRRRGRGPGEADGGDDGGNKPRVPPQRPPEPSDTLEPDWWPEFERDFAAHAAKVRSARPR